MDLSDAILNHLCKNNKNFSYQELCKFSNNVPFTYRPQNDERVSETIISFFDNNFVEHTTKDVKLIISDTAFYRITDRGIHYVKERERKQRICLFKNGLNYFIQYGIPSLLLLGILMQGFF